MLVEIDLPDDVIPTEDLVMRAMIDGLTQQCSKEILDAIKIGQVVQGLAKAADLAPLGKYGSGLRVFLGKDPKRERKIMQLILDAIYETADVPRP